MSFITKRPPMGAYKVAAELQKAADDIEAAVRRFVALYADADAKTAARIENIPGVADLDIWLVKRIAAEASAISAEEDDRLARLSDDCDRYEATAGREFDLVHPCRDLVGAAIANMEAWA